MPVQGFEFKVTERKLTCPFNPAHQVTDMQKHLTRCSSYNKDVRVKLCPFNATHWIKEPEFRHHLDRCPDKAPIDRAVLAMKAGAEGTSGDLSMPVTWSARNEAVENQVEGWDNDGSDEWDVEVSQLPRHMRQKYDPKVATQNREIFRVPTEHRGKSARNEFRRQNVERAQAIQNGSEAGSVVGASSAAAPSVSSIGARRRPMSNPICCNGMNINPNLGMGRARRPAPAALPAALVGEPAGGDGAPAASARPAVVGRGRGAITSQLKTPGVRIGADGDRSTSGASN
ncbi:uncharacterized protein LOC122393535 [Amphibalanus amphitrite]|uniref:uncharacterized protein LOC122393535 n=1 Tax=Amphibalanus amphitrite TaxID=1232801 RepID=UPI001C914197|nr:uncharacterized protein LOC122393535 [Amphibalanus amphitrite]XP_043245631.1 uncharacterized protein LOC122393535 [Amphibalanus amphitrite]XP_043245633.1 uncharacterized protein LOC122393535 [Amphibalanus amphitrite]